MPVSLEFSGTLVGFDDYVSKLYHSGAVSKWEELIWLRRYGIGGCNRIVSFVNFHYQIKTDSL